VKVTLDTDKLRLPGAGAGWEGVADPSRQRAGAIEALRELASLGLTGSEVRRLLRRIAVESTANAIVQRWPTVGEDRAVLRAAADLAQALALVLAGASPKAQAEMATAAHLALRDPTYSDRAARDLLHFSVGLRQRIANMPTQGRRKSPVSIVRAVHEVAGSRLGSVTHWPEAPFRRACVAALTLAGRPGFPDNAIKALAAELDVSP
jgi:hypothetical protein